MSQVTQILLQINGGDSEAAERLLPLVYEELRRLAAHYLDHERPGQTLQPTALVHDAYLRLVDVDQAAQWDSHGHFFRRQPKRCEGSWSRMRAENEDSSEAEIIIAWS